MDSPRMEMSALECSVEEFASNEKNEPDGAEYRKDQEQNCSMIQMTLVLLRQFARTVEGRRKVRLRKIVNRILEVLVSYVLPNRYRCQRVGRECMDRSVGISPDAGALPTNESEERLDIEDTMSAADVKESRWLWRDQLPGDEAGKVGKGACERSRPYRNGDICWIGSVGGSDSEDDEVGVTSGNVSLPARNKRRGCSKVQGGPRCRKSFPNMIMLPSERHTDIP
nr:unnamed protein product [Haemonchus contortus]